MSRTRLLSPEQEQICYGAMMLARGRLVAMPTETVYGLAGDARNPAAVAAIFAAKGRPSFNPLIVHAPDLATAEGIGIFDAPARALAQAFWPGALTLVVPLRPGAGIASLVTAGLDTVAIRVPAHPVAQDLLRSFGGVVAAPSANPSGRISPTSAAHVMAGLGGRLAAVIDAGPSPVGVESTIIGWQNGRPVLLRPGGIPAETIEARLGQTLDRPEAQAGAPRPAAPGMLASHYAPRAPVRLNAESATGDEFLIGFGTVAGEITLSASADLAEAAAALFDALHRADASARPIAIAPVPDHGLGRAINDRLRRAAAPRDG
ncbi:MAG: L-threonylcarbamoyladenylate synthase [Paracoccus sp. (in: a-proteobacteria)]|nr:L-threonylcarbamoyladenylate synthase [Paracoccus sp. (in: a-proteobacteria)]